MKLRVTLDAADDLTNINTYLSALEPAISTRVLARIATVIETLLLWPRLGHAGHRAGTYEIVVPRLPFLIVYRLDRGIEEELIILRVYHARRDRPHPSAD
ncbi:MAG: type II toxin-antitoxin system RelE/ParE family toxin [Vicinamibacterales bacterium]